MELLGLAAGRDAKAAGAGARDAAPASGRGFGGSGVRVLGSL